MTSKEFAEQQSYSIRADVTGLSSFWLGGNREAFAEREIEDLRVAALMLNLLVTAMESK